jgi:hypothetical protein
MSACRGQPGGSLKENAHLEKTKDADARLPLEARSGGFQSEARAARGPLQAQYAGRFCAGQCDRSISGCGATGAASGIGTMLRGYASMSLRRPLEA